MYFKTLRKIDWLFHEAKYKLKNNLDKILEFKNVSKMIFKYQTN